MPIHTTLTDLFTDIAEAIRGKSGSTEAITADNFPTAISNITEKAPDNFLAKEINASQTASSSATLSGMTNLVSAIIVCETNLASTADGESLSAVATINGTQVTLDNSNSTVFEVAPPVTGTMGRFKLFVNNKNYADSIITNITGISASSGNANRTVTTMAIIKSLVDLTELCFTANTAGSTVELIKNGSPSINSTAYSYDRQTWTEFSPSETRGTNTITLTNVGDKVYFRNNITGDFSEDNYLQFVMSGSIKASGNINSLYSAENFNSIVGLTYSYCYLFLFFNCDALTQAPELPALILSEGCYGGMFAKCTSLVDMPQLPATTLATLCYAAMFTECTSLLTVTNLQATTLTGHCYKAMFDGCTSLKVAPAIAATTVATNCCEDMFYGCSSLITPPPILATNELDISCYAAMFMSCQSLLTAPVLPATILSNSCYNCMFYGCRDLRTAPELPAMTLYSKCYNSMFWGCSSLVTAPNLPATTLASECYSNMFYGCTSLMMAPVLPAETLASSCYNGMFGECVNLVEAPALPSTTLAPSCYRSMFYTCVNLTKVPELPATTLYNMCYTEMFAMCTSLQVSDTQTTEAQYAWTIPASGTFTNETTYNQSGMFYECLGTRVSDTMSGAKGESHTYYIQNKPVSKLPVKGEFISMNLGNDAPEAGDNNIYRVLNITNSIAEVVAMYDMSKSQSFGSDNIYAGSDIDMYLNTTFYDTLSSVAKTAIVDKNITQYQYNYNSEIITEAHASSADYSTKAVKGVVGNRHVYALDIEDIENYFNSVFSKADIWNLFWTASSKPSEDTSPLLRSANPESSLACWVTFSYLGTVEPGNVSFSYSARPALTIDLSKIDFTIIQPV